MTRPTSQQIQELKRALLAQRKELLADAQDELIRWGQHPIGELAGDVPDVGDESVATMVTDLDHTIVARHVETVRDIDAALRRIKEHRYALCADCGDDIELRRLRAFPTAKRCVDCQSLHERTYVHRAMPTL